MSEGTAKEITCKACNKKVPLGKFCLNCASSLNTGQTESTDGPRPPIQVSDGSSSSSSGTGTKSSSQQSDTSVVGLSPTNNPGSHQSNISTMSVATTSTTTVTSSYADKVKSPKQNIPPSQQPNNSLASDVTTNSDPQSQDSRHRNTREGSRAANGAPGKPESGGNSLREV